jgi:cbb3-type cytochrome c oxidase subunit I
MKNLIARVARRCYAAPAVARVRGGGESLRLRDNAASAAFIVSGSIWILAGVSMGLILAFQFVFPDLFRGVSWLVFGRLRAAHVNTVMFAFLSSGMMGTWLYIVPRLTGRKLWSEGLGVVTVVLWNVAVAAGIVGLLTAHTQGREYAEFIWYVDVGVMVVLILTAINIYMTISHRVERKLYVSLWYIIGTLVWIPLLYFIGNVMWNPPSGAITGVNDSIYNWFYGHNVLGLWFTTGLLPVIYYLVPKETRTPLYSHVLSLIAFWGIIFFYTGVGGHHLLWAPLPYWLKTIAVAMSIGMFLPVVAFMMNIFLTMRGNWNRVITSIPLRFVVTGWAAYILVSYQGSHASLRSMNLLMHFSQYVPAHGHLSLVFFSASVMMGAAYYIIPRIYDCRIYSRFLANVQFAFYAIGFFLFFMGFTFTGLVQGSSWVHGGLPIWGVLPTLKPYMALRAVGGALLYLSFLLFAWNVLATIIFKLPVSRPPAGSGPPEETLAPSDAKGGAS